MKKKVVRLTEEDLVRIVKKVIREQSEDLNNAEIETLFIKQGRMGSYVKLSNGKTYKYSEGSNLKLPSMGYAQQCKPGEYSGNNLPQYCSVSISLDDGSRYICDNEGCKKREER